MSRAKQFWWSVSAIALTVAASVAAPALQTRLMAQDFTPFIDPLEFDPDWQWFAPIDMMSLSEMSPKKRANYGWFASHDRTRTWISRPEVGYDSPFTNEGMGDFTWGHRTDLGFVRENGSGWLFNFRRVTTDCGVWDSVLTERINRYVEDEDEDGGGFFPTTFPWPDRNDTLYAGRFYNVSDSLNVAYYNDFEINKTWRKSPYRYGGFLEPFIGLRYSSFEDIAQDQNYERSTINQDTPGTVDTSTQLEILTTDRTQTLNRMLGGQVGARYFIHYHRWRLSADFRTFLAGNFQANHNVFTTESTYYSGGPSIGGEVNSILTNSTFVHRANNSTVWGYEIRADAAYQLTKYIGVRGGVEVIELARGIWRGGTSFRGNMDSRNQHVFMAGMTFGVELNR